ncbi:hypothetical protein MUY35_15015 [Aliiroseovarius sp. S1339]|uniref:hypothetical protein n=1 Tax=Aliiroseovarius sp. S1339 TaxID=2936990 RepID=UPI0020C13AD1|nr:hypothetical protein [Aliiroseovarius sp. S1339]MCK8465168.1 hypothetical protein [Aliiroseovarius sp. S1339]
MTREREVGTLWIGGALSWMEQLCLKSFVDKGQKITLFSYENIPNVPAGVIRRDGREIIDTDDFIKYEHKNSFALFADWFRLHMIHKCSGMIWVDTDVYCHRPMNYDSDFVFGFELPGEHRVNNAVLGLPSDSELLSEMLLFTEDRYSIAPFIAQRKQREFQQAADDGNPVHISQQPWGVWGPMMVTHYVHKLGLEELVQPLDAFYPITFRERVEMLQPASVVEAKLTANTTALHLWASNKKQIGNQHHGLPPVGSYLEQLVKHHDIVAPLAPVKGRGNSTFDTGLLDHLDLNAVNSVADLSGNAQGLILALYHRFDCDIFLVSANRQGQITEQPQDWIDPYRTFLTQNGVPQDRIHIICSEADLRPVDVLCNLDGFGCAYKVKFLEPFLSKMMHSDSRMFMDIKKGSGAFPFLRNFGENEPVSTFEADGKSVSRIRFTPNPPAVVDNDEGWAAIARTLAGDGGFFRMGPEGHSFVYTPRSQKTLVVTFDNLDITMTKRADRRPWGFAFIEEQGWSMLGVLAGGWTWYRNQWVCDQFDDLRDSGFFMQFDRVVFYGASMGGYAAAAFSAAAPGSDVIAISPQSTLDKTIVPWEERYKTAWDRDFSGEYGDATTASQTASTVYILYDPYEPLDSGHVNRFTGTNVVKLRAPLLGHRLGSSLNQMGILSPIILGALQGTLSETEYYQHLRTRRTFPRYQRELFERLVKKGHIKLARQLGRYVLARNANRKIKLAMKDLG